MNLGQQDDELDVGENLKHNKSPIPKSNPNQKLLDDTGGQNDHSKNLIDNQLAINGDLNERLSSSQSADDLDISTGERQ